MRHWFLALFCALGLGAQDLRVQVLATSDLHGHFRPEDTYSLKPTTTGWNKLASLIKAKKAQNPNTVLVDCGDTLQGEPVNYVRNRLHPDWPEPSIALMNSLGYAAMVVGNHEYDFGLDVLRAAEKQARFPFLSANTFKSAGGKTAFATHIKVQVGGANVLVVGFTTPSVPRLMDAKAYGGYVFQDIVESARTLLPSLREKEKADVVVVAMHSGLGSLPGAPGDEDAALRLADQVPGIDLILTGHTHQPISIEHRGVPILQPSCFGQALAVADLDLRKEKGRWHVSARAGRLMTPRPETPVDPEAQEISAQPLAATDRYLDTFATNLQVDLDARPARMEDTPLGQLLHAVLRQATGAQITAVSINQARIYIPKGPTSVRQFYSLMAFENQGARIRITGQQLRAYLEHAARYFNFSHEPELFNRAMPGYDYDILDGCGYVLDLSRPVGSRVTELTVGGQPVQDPQVFTLGLTTYRLFGGGGYMEAIGWRGQPDYVTPEGIRNLLLAYVLARPSLSLEVPQRWHTVPYLDRERVYQQIR